MIAKLAKNSSYVSEQKKMGVGKNKDPDDEEMEWIETFLNRFLLKINNKNTRTRCEIRSKLTIKTLERRHWRRCGVFIVNFEHISQLVLVFLLLI